MQHGAPPPRPLSDPSLPPPHTPPSPQVINVLDLCCGAGGLSFMAQQDASVRIVSRWAVDKLRSAILTIKANHGDELHAFCMGIDEFLFVCKQFEVLVARYCGKGGAAPRRDKRAKGAEQVCRRPYVRLYVTLYVMYALLRLNLCLHCGAPFPTTSIECMHYLGACRLAIPSNHRCHRGSALHSRGTRQVPHGQRMGEWLEGGKEDVQDDWPTPLSQHSTQRLLMAPRARSSR